MLGAEPAAHQDRCSQAGRQGHGASSPSHANELLVGHVGLECRASPGVHRGDPTWALKRIENDGQSEAWNEANRGTWSVRSNGSEVYLSWATIITCTPVPVVVWMSIGNFYLLVWGWCCILQLLNTLPPEQAVERQRCCLGGRNRCPV